MFCINAAPPRNQQSCRDRQLPQVSGGAKYDQEPIHSPLTSLFTVLRSFATGDQHQVVRCFVEFINTPVALWLGLNDVGCLESIG